MPTYVNFIGTTLDDLYTALGVSVRISSKAGDDVLTGSDYADRINSGSGDDWIMAAGGDDTINGGQGIDVAVYRGAIEQYLLAFGTNGNLKGTVTDSVEGRDGTDSLKQVEYIEFSNAVYDVVNDVVYILNAPPLATGDAYTTTEDTSLIVGAAAGLLANDEDPDGDEALLTASIVSGPAHGDVTLNADGSFTYTPHANYNGSDSFTYTASDGSASSNVATVSITIDPDAPALNLLDAAGVEDSEIALSITALPADSGEALTITIANVPDGAMLSAGTRGTDGTWTLTVADLAELTITPPANSESSFDLQVTATSTDASGGIGSTSGSLHVEVTPAFDGTAVDGYIVGATVFADANNNGVLDAGEVHTTTGANGGFSLVGGSGPLVMFGGTDMSTGLPFTGTLRAPAGSSVVTPLTTVLAAMVPADADAAAVASAQTQLLDALGLTLPADASLTTYDPVQEALTGDSATALEIYAAGVQVQNTIVLAAEATDTTMDTASTAVVDALVGAIGGSTGTGSVQLTDTGTLTTLVSAADTTGTANVSSAVDVISATNTAVSSSLATTDPVAVLTEVAQAAVVAQSEDAAAAASGTNTSDFLATLDTTIANAEVGAVAGSELGTAGNDELTVASSPGSLDGLAGDDLLTGGGANDYLFGGLGRDVLRGLAGDDQLFGDAGNDVLIGAEGADVLDGGENLPDQRADIDAVSYAINDDIVGATGVDVNLATGTASDGLGSTDTLANIEKVVGTKFDDVFTGGDPTNAGTTVSEQFEGRGGNDTIVGGSDNNLVLYDNAAGAVRLNLGPTVVHTDGIAIEGGKAVDGDGGLDTLTNINHVRGSAHDDVIYGSSTTSGNERFEGLGGADFIHGRGGLDYVMYQNAPGAVTVNLAPSHVDSGTASDGYGTTDTFIGIEGVRGSKFDDVLTGSDRTDFVEAFEGMAGNDTIDGRAGPDRMEFYQSPSRVIVNFRMTSTTVEGVTIAGRTAHDGFGTTDTFSGIEHANGSLFNDIFIVNNGINRIDGRLGFDTVSFEIAPAGVTVNLGITGGANVSGGSNADTLVSIEKVIGSAFDDLLIGGTANDVLVGAAGNDRLIGGAGNDRLFGSAGNDFLNGAGGADYIDGGEGSDTLDRSAGTSSQNIDLAAGTNGSATLVSIENATGSAHADVIRGDANANVLDGRGGDDDLQAGAGDDSYRYTVGDGIDTINDSEGTDTLFIFGTLGDDTLNVTWTGGSTIATFAGGTLAGVDHVALNMREGVNDALVYDGATADIAVTLDGPASGFNGFILGVEHVTTGAGSDTIVGNGADNTIIAGSGDDAIKTGDGMDWIDGGDGIDTLDLSDDSGAQHITLLPPGKLDTGFDTVFNIENVIGSNGADRIQGSDLANELSGGGDDDLLEGEGGDDTLTGGPGTDTLTGGLGADRFVYASIDEGLDQITDFTAGAGGDVLDLRSVLVGYSTGSDAAAFVQLEEFGGVTTVSVSPEGTGTDFVAIASLESTSGLLLGDLMTNGNLLLG